MLGSKLSKPWLLIIGTALAAPAASAGESALLQLIEVLRANGTLDAQTHAALEAAVRAEQTPAVASERAGTEVGFGEDGLVVTSEDGDFELELGGRLHVDAAWYDDDDVELGRGAEVRRARAELAATLWRDWDLKASVDFAGDEVSLKSTYLRYTGIDPVRVTVGRFKESFGLERLGSSNDTVFMERAALTTFTPGRNVGVGVSGYGDHFSASLGFFSGEDDFVTDDEEVDESWGTSGRLTVAPFSEEGRVLHLGGALAYRMHDRDATVRFRSRPESRVTDVRFVDTGDIGGLDDVMRAGAEAATVLGPVLLQGEYMRTWVDRRSGASDLAFDGWYALASWVVTGESHGYQRKRGRIRGVRPAENFGRGGLGAWEVAVRFSTIDLSDHEIRGGEQDIVALGVNWYLNPNLRVMANYLNVYDVRSTAAFDDEDPQIFQLRAQVDF